MRLSLKTKIALLAISLSMLVPAMASAERIYYLVGVRHVYLIGPNRDLQLPRREEIEKNYADDVAADQATYQQHVAAGADKTQESILFNNALEDDAVQRDQKLGAIFEQRDDLRADHPQLQIRVDGPYQVVGIEQHWYHGALIFDHFAVFAPWPGYIAVGGYYGGWQWGLWYTPGLFVSTYGGWYGHYRSVPFFGFYGHHGSFPMAIHGYVRGSWHPGVHANAVVRGGSGYHGDSGYHGNSGSYHGSGSHTGYEHVSHNSGGGHGGGSDRGGRGGSAHDDHSDHSDRGHGGGGGDHDHGNGH